MPKEAKIINFNEAVLKPTMTTINIEYSCKHRSVIVDAENRTIECNHCGADIDAFDFIMKDAEQEEFMHQRYEYLKTAINSLQSQKDRLEKELTQKLHNKKK